MWHGEKRRIPGAGRRNWKCWYQCIFEKKAGRFLVLLEKGPSSRDALAVGSFSPEGPGFCFPVPLLQRSQHWPEHGEGTSVPGRSQWTWLPA